MFVTRTTLVDLDDDEAGEERRKPNEMEDEVKKCASALLGWGMGGLEDEGCLRSEQKTRRVQ